MMIREKKPRYLVSEIDEIENGETYNLVRKGAPKKAKKDKSPPSNKKKGKTNEKGFPILEVINP